MHGGRRLTFTLMGAVIHDALLAEGPRYPAVGRKETLPIDPVNPDNPLEAMAPLYRPGRQRGRPASGGRRVSRPIDPEPTGPPGHTFPPRPSCGPPPHSRRRPLGPERFRRSPGPRRPWPGCPTPHDVARRRVDRDGPQACLVLAAPPPPARHRGRITPAGTAGGAIPGRPSPGRWRATRRVSPTTSRRSRSRVSPCSVGTGRVSSSWTPLVRGARVLT